MPPPSKPPRGSSCLFRLCLFSTLLYCVALAVLLNWRLYSDSQSANAARPPSDTSALDDAVDPDQLCLRRPRSQKPPLLVEVPFTKGDISSLELSVTLWEDAWPCYSTSPSQPDLVLAFNGNLSEPAHAQLRARLTAVTARRVVTECFGRVSIESAYLSGDADTYDKQRLNANWTLGPNNLFFHFLQQAATRGYRYMVQLEPDIIPLRRLWLEQLNCLATHSSAWVIGSPFLSLCATDAHAHRCQELGDTIKFHINGNAMYAVGDPTFRSYWARAFAGQLSLWPFDLSLHMYSATLPDAGQRRAASKFRIHPFILNFGGEPLTTAAAAAATSSSVLVDERPLQGGGGGGGGGGDDGAALAASAGPVPLLRHASPSSYLLHSSWAMAKLRTEGAAGYEALGLKPPASVAAAAAGSSKAVAAAEGGAPSAADTLLPLARRLADSQGRLILTFTTALYDPLCRNFVSHLRRLHVENYLLATFTAAYHQKLVARGEQPYLHELPDLSSDGSDVFASRDFFMINSARYTVLTLLLRAGIHVFSVDLDVVLLQDPIPHVWSLPYDVLLQSDARDARTLKERSPFLLRDRLHLTNSSGVSYVNGGVFFARGTHAVARLFDDTWAMTSQDLGTLNEQDCLNRMLIASSLRWAPLPPELFPNGYVYFRRPIAAAVPAKQSAPSTGGSDGGGPVLVHCNWINGIAAKRFLLSEAMIWGDGGASVSGNRGGDGSYLAYMVGKGAEQRTLGAQVRALVTALALSVASNRTLVLPSFYVVPSLGSRAAAAAHASPSHLSSNSSRRYLAEHAAAAAHEAQSVGRRVFTYLFEYAPMLRHFPNHRESSLLRVQWPSGLPPAAPVPRPAAATTTTTTAAVTEAEEGEEEDGGDTTATTTTATSSGSSSSIGKWLAEHGSEPLLYLWGLERTPLPSVLCGASQEAAFRTRLRSALQPAPELRVISHHIITKIQSKLAAHSEGRSGKGGGRHRRLQGGKGGGKGRKLLSGSLRDDLFEFLGDNGGGLEERPSSQDFNCLHVSESELSSPEKLKAAAGSLPLDAPTLIVREVGGLVNSDGSTTPAGASSPRARRKAAAAVARLGVDGVSADIPSVLAGTSVAKVFGGAAMEIRDFYPYWDDVEVLDGGGTPTLAYDLVQQLVCAASRRVQGSRSSDFVHGVCHWRHSTSVMTKLLDKGAGSSMSSTVSGTTSGTTSRRRGLEASARISMEAAPGDVCAAIHEFS